MADEDRYRIAENDLTGPEIAALLTLHLAEMNAWSPAESVHAMGIERLRAADVTFYAAWDGAHLASCGAIKDLGNGEGELKSMRADPAYRGCGAGRAILLHLIAVARARGYARLWLETGSTDPFVPARQLYASHGFTQCGPFAEYSEDPFSIFMTKDL